ncbi:MAG: nicotinamide-nucleotide amidohydrolase family protein [Bdellovibrio sp.]|nr:nicotinamide-nucleotide amidohydrolase family protein [Bdellovibrio sp.]
MRTGLLIIGSEILSGRTQDKNLETLATVLREKGMVIDKVVIIKDEIATIVENMRHLMQEFEWTFCSGGLGPTRDDMTKEALCQLTGVSLQENQQAEDLARRHYQRYGRTWSKETNSYHLIPKGIIPLENPAGLAPGLFLTKNNRQLYCLPGVPREFNQMLIQTVLPLVERHPSFQRTAIEYLTLRTYGVPEEKIFFQLCPTLWDDLEKYGEVSSLPHTVGVDIIIKLKQGLRPNEIEQTVKQLPSLAPLLSHIWQWGALSFHHYLVELCRQKNIKLAVAESCTGGLVAHKITMVPGASQIFLGAVVSYSNEIKKDILEVNPKTLQTHGAVSVEVASEMANNIRQHFKSDFALATTGIAGPEGGTTQKPVGLICIAIAGPDSSVITSTYNMKGDREQLKERFSDRALLDLILRINK